MKESYHETHNDCSRFAGTECGAGSVFGFTAEGGGRSATHMKVRGVVSKVQSGITTVKTPWGR